jgi:hypothetical protein
MMKSSMSLILVVACYCALTAGAFSIDTPKSSNNPLPSTTTMLSRRGAVIGGAAALVGGLATLPNLAAAAVPAETTDLSTYSDLSSGIKYLVIKEGNGDKPVRSQQIYTKYTFWTGGFPEDAGSNKIDSNTGLKEPFGVVVGVGKVIKGWDLALLDMKLGEVRRLVIPSAAGYGAEGAGNGKIPPDATLYYQVEIIYMNKAPQLSAEQLEWMEANPV